MGVSSCCRRKELPMIEGRMRDESELARRLSASGLFGDAITCALDGECCWTTLAVCKYWKDTSCFSGDEW